MKTTADFIDELKYKLKLRFDGEVAALFGWKSQQMSRYRTLESSFSDKTALRVAELLEIDPAYVIACMRAQSSTRPEVKTIWERIARKVAIVALGAFTGFLAAPSPADARTSHNQNFGLSGPEYTLRRFRRGWWAAMAATLFGLAGCTVSARAHADELDAALLGGALATLAADWSQTRSIAQNPGRFRETNPILGEHPSVGRVNSYFALAMIGTAGLAFALPREHSRIFLGGLMLLETAVVIRNDGIGIRASF